MFSIAFSFIACPSCGESIMPLGIQLGNEPKHLTETYSNCKKIIEVKRDPATGKLMAEEVKPN